MAQTPGLLVSVIVGLVSLPVHAQNPQRSIQIAAIESQLIELRKVYTENYPGIRKLEVQLQTLRNGRDATTQNSTASLSAQSNQRAAQIATIEAQLIELREVYTENYPGIRKLEIQLQTLRDQRDAEAR